MGVTQQILKIFPQILPIYALRCPGQFSQIFFTLPTALYARYPEDLAFDTILIHRYTFDTAHKARYVVGDIVSTSSEPLNEFLIAQVPLHPDYKMLTILYTAIALLPLVMPHYLVVFHC